MRMRLRVSPGSSQPQPHCTTPEDTIVLPPISSEPIQELTCCAPLPLQVNEDVDQRTLLRKYERELRRLRAELQQRQRELVDKRHLLAVRLGKKLFCYLGKQSL